MPPKRAVKRARDGSTTENATPQEQAKTEVVPTPSTKKTTKVGKPAAASASAAPQPKHTKLSVADEEDDDVVELPAPTSQPKKKAVSPADYLAGDLSFLGAQGATHDDDSGDEGRAFGFTSATDTEEEKRLMDELLAKGQNLSGHELSSFMEDDLFGGVDAHFSKIMKRAKELENSF